MERKSGKSAIIPSLEKFNACYCRFSPTVDLLWKGFCYIFSFAT